LASDVAGVETDIGEQAVERRDAGQHAGCEALGAGAPDGFVRRVREDARVAVEDRADPSPLSHRGKDPLDDLLIGIVARLADAVGVDQILGAGRQGEQPLERQEVRHQDEVSLGGADRSQSLARDVRRAGESDAGDGERTPRARFPARR
jgi:hypothetical protein